MYLFFHSLNYINYLSELVNEDNFLRCDMICVIDLVIEVFSVSQNFCKLLNALIAWYQGVFV